MNANDIDLGPITSAGRSYSVWLSPNKDHIFIHAADQRLIHFPFPWVARPREVAPDMEAGINDRLKRYEDLRRQNATAP
jgi:hypothetical protein